MSASVTDAQYRRAAFLVSKVAEPAIKKLVDALNDELKKTGVMAGVECRWYFDKLPETTGKEDT